MFLYCAVVGIAAGTALAIVALWIRRELRNDPALEIVLGLVDPVRGLHAGRGAGGLRRAGGRRPPASSSGSCRCASTTQTRMQERQVWGALDVLLEAFVFAYMGLQLRFVIEDLQDAHVSVW